MVSVRADVGARGEAIAAAHLRKLGFEVVAQNARVGRLELDLVARSGDLFVFCEVRTRQSRQFLDPVDTLDRRKQRNVRQAALGWLRSQQIFAREMRFDAASVVLEPEPALTYYEGAF